MRRLLVQFRNSSFRSFVRRHGKYAPILFFIGGFIFDMLTLGRIDRTYDLVMLCLHMTSLSFVLYLYNVVDDGKWKNTFLERFEEYFPLAIQFFFGALSSAYVIYFSRSVSLSKTVSFFLILVALLVANEFLKQRISNKYLQFSVYFFLSFTFFTFMIPVAISKMSPALFYISGGISLLCTLTLIILIYFLSPSTRSEIRLGRLLAIILSIYVIINLFYYFRLIPPVPLALDQGIVAHYVEKTGNEYTVTYEKNDSFIFWRDHRLKFVFSPNENVYIYSSIFAPTNLEQSIIHRWKWFNVKTSEWELIEDIGYEIIGGRDEGYRGYTYKSNIWAGEWKVEVITNEELVLGVIDFEISIDENLEPIELVERKF
ncbi:DUF2914 domain-containing protein [Maribacter sp. 4G9]|uniref:DUF2914 domain-containing protein n=1 Tax=Maribacter sp. 4G9 TaxID=1889777 RepID=UPI000C153EA7|nr:DUF2914 domain-containing protein [Maribacter sp. 4G9]PIB25244.1 hypothetical protein BFP75_09410 [Maribacter sp. 4G9]